MIQSEATSTLDVDDQPDQPTNLVESEILEYVSIRITTPRKWEDIENLVNDFEWYISYPHIGKNGNNPHYHIAVPGNGKVLERIRKRIKDAGLHGNKCFSGTCYQNSILQYIQYTSREETQPYIKGNVQSWIDKAPRWIQANLLDNLNPARGVPKPRKGGIMLTSARMLYQIWKWRQERRRFDLHKIEDCLMYMLEEMDDEGEPKYFISPEWARRGMPSRRRG